MRIIAILLLSLAAADAFSTRRAASLRSASRPTSSTSRLQPIKPSSSSTTTTTLSSFPVTAFSSPTNIKATFSLLLSAAAGVKIDRRLPGTGIMATLCTATLLSASRWAPSAHAFYNVGWTTFLPASLVFLLLSLPVNSPSDKANSKAVTTSIARLGIPFCIASIGSLLGCTASYLFFTKASLPASLSMAPGDALLAASCLAASFIGGSVNFLATAAALGTATKTGTKTLLSSMASADVLVMTLYLAGLAACMRSKPLQQWFSGDKRAPATSGSEDKSAPSAAVSGISTTGGGGLDLGSLATAGVSILTAAGIVQLANRVEPMLSHIVPGTACAVITLVTPLVQKLLASTVVNAAMLENVAGRLFEYTFLLMFASMGMSVNVKTVMQNGPMCTVFSGLALLVHGAVTLLGTKIYRSIVDPSVTLADTLVASNAAIGGAATAAAFAGQGPSDQRKDLVVAGTAWGVFGYAIGTTAGLTLYRALSGSFR